jgi:ubiquinol-cytochrome c reductase cytochrome c1 subunit
MRILKAFTVAASLFAASPALAAGEGPALPDVRFSFEGLFGTFDRASAQRGLQVYKEVCSACHGMRLLSYRNLMEIGLSEAEIRTFAAAYTVTDGPNDEGAMFERPARLSDRIRSPYPNDQAARAANNGALPPDLSVIVKARQGGADYIHALLTGYRDPPPGVTVMDGLYYNEYYPGHQIAMPSVLNEGQVEYADQTPASVEQMAKDVSTFLAWASEPEMEQRKQLGVKILIFLSILGGLVYATKRRIWADVKH